MKQFVDINKKTKEYLRDIKTVAELARRFSENCQYKLEEAILRLNFTSFWDACRMVKKEEDAEIEGYVRRAREMRAGEAAGKHAAARGSR
ncbi:MAG: hypothetical protein LBT92_04050 [Rickettsiales bacterium]|jgi:hypothetical protein|nr:hypothetical protein [Rickettsiales bacterium]